MNNEQPVPVGSVSYVSHTGELEGLCPPPVFGRDTLEAEHHLEKKIERVMVFRSGNLSSLGYAET